VSADPSLVRAFTAGQEINDDHFRAHVIDQLGELREAMSEVATPDGIAKAVEDGMRSALVNPETWAEAMKGIQKAAQQEAGGWLIGGIKSFLSRVAWVVVIGLGVYMLGGWTALAALLKSGGTSHG